MATRLVWGILLIPVLALCACDPPKGSQGGAVAVCTQVGQRCTHSPGKLGVCTPANESSCDVPPCLSCASQH